jgi:hypothetical protein
MNQLGPAIRDWLADQLDPNFTSSEFYDFIYYSCHYIKIKEGTRGLSQGTRIAQFWVRNDNATLDGVVYYNLSQLTGCFLPLPVTASYKIALAHPDSLDKLRGFMSKYGIVKPH